jgi:serine/threonine protein kinase
MREGVISHYHLLDKLGEGAMGEVYRAEDTRLRRTVALKFLAAGRLTDAGLRQRFLHEAQAAASLDHSNICTVYEVDDQDGEIFLAMAYIDGPTLQKKISQRPLQLEEAVEIAIQIGEGLEAAHERGIVHRDIKSSNILLTSRGQAKITDFGLAILADQTRLTQTGAMVGTPGYMSPEQARSEGADARSDLWSLGVVLYEMVSGQLPFGGNTAPAAIFAILHREPEPLTALRSGVPLELDRIVAKALAKNAAQRYQHVADILVDLRAVKKLLESRPQAVAAERESPASLGPVWSPDGKHLLFYGVKPGNPPVSDWWVAPVDGGPPTGAQVEKAIPATGAAQPPVSWTPDGIVFMRGSTVEGYNLFSVPIAEKTWALGKPLRQITSGPGMKFGNALLPGGQMLFDISTVELQVAAAPFDAGSANAGAEPRPLTRDAAQKFRASVSLDGGTLTFSSVGGLERPQRQLRVMNVNTGTETAIPLSGSRFFVSPHMSPEGTVLAYTDDIGPKAVTFVVSPDGSGARQICEGCAVSNVFPGGKSVLVNEGMAYLKLDLVSAQRTPVFARPPGTRVRDARLSDVARWLTILLDKPNGECGIFILPMESLPVAAENWIPVIQNSGWLSCPRIAPGGKWVLYYSDRDGEICVRVRRLDLAARQPVGEPRVVLRPHSAQFGMVMPRFEFFLEVSRERLLFPCLRARGTSG